LGKRVDIGIVDYDMGNLMSVSRAFASQGFSVTVSEDAGKLECVSGLVLPGVGAFRDCMRNLEERGLTGFIRDWILSGKYFLGICLGLQLLFTESLEFGVYRGFELIKGQVVKFPHGMKEPTSYAEGTEEEILKVPHMGWNQVHYPEGSPFFQGIPQDSNFYFVHSYYVVPGEEVRTCRTKYGIEFVSGIERDNVISVQFHPEKSQKVGLRLLKNFGTLAVGERMQS